jgi:RNA polymerase sigma-70 factor (ECF subfamily)
VLDPNVVMRGDDTAAKMGGPRQMSGSHTVAKAFSGRAQGARSALVDGAVGIVVAPKGRLLLVLGVTIVNGRITAINGIADPDRLAGLEFALPQD